MPRRPNGSTWRAPYFSNTGDCPRPEHLARVSSISLRQAYRYLEQAQQLKRPVPVGDAKASFTVKLSRKLVDRLRVYAASTGLTLSEIVSRAVLTVLHRGGGRG